MQILANKTALLRILLIVIIIWRSRSSSCTIGSTHRKKLVYEDLKKNRWLLKPYGFVRVYWVNDGLWKNRLKNYSIFKVCPNQNWFIRKPNKFLGGSQRLVCNQIFSLLFICVLLQWKLQEEKTEQWTRLRFRNQGVSRSKPKPGKWIL